MLSTHSIPLGLVVSQQCSIFAFWKRFVVWHLAFANCLVVPIVVLELAPELVLIAFAAKQKKLKGWVHKII